MANPCKMCGMCCWNWKENNPSDRCEHLVGDLKTCGIYDVLAIRRPECNSFPDLPQVCDLPGTCRFVELWKKEGKI